MSPEYQALMAGESGGRFAVAISRLCRYIVRPPNDAATEGPRAQWTVSPLKATEFDPSGDATLRAAPSSITLGPGPGGSPAAPVAGTMANEAPFSFAFMSDGALHLSEAGFNVEL